MTAETSARACGEGEAPMARAGTPRYSVSRAKQPCGTYAAARRHERRGEPVCPACEAARREWWRERARIAASIPAMRAKENARTAERQRRRRQEDAEWRARMNARRRALHRAQLEAARNAPDEIAVERACRGEAVRLTRAERLEAVRVMLGRGLLRTHIADRLHVNGQTVNALIAAVTDETEAVA